MTSTAGYYVYIVDEGRVRRQPIELGLQGKDRLQVVSGLSEGDIVIIVGQQGLREGQEVRPMTADGELLDGGGPSFGQAPPGPFGGPPGQPNVRPST